jgi:hypothetical protein
MERTAVQVHSLLTEVPDGGEQSTLCSGRFTPTKQPQHALNRRPGGPQSWSRQFEEEKNLLHMTGAELHTTQISKRH